MSLRHVVKTVAVSSAATVCAAVFALGIGSGVAGANTLTSSDGNTTLNTIGSVTSGTPYTSGQVINVGEAANSVISTTALAADTSPAIPSEYQSGVYYLEECTDVGGTAAGLPKSASGCEAATLVTTGKTSSGAFSKNDTIYDLPDFNTLGTPTMTGTCDVAPNTCVIGIFISNPQSVGATFSYPDLFSAPFQTTVGDGSDVGDDPGDGTPEVPLAIGLPLAALAVFGGFTMRNRRRRRPAA